MNIEQKQSIESEIEYPKLKKIDNEEDHCLMKSVISASHLVDVMVSKLLQKATASTQ